MTSLVCSDPSKMVCSDPPRMVCSDPYKVGGSLQTILEGSLQTKDVIDGAGCIVEDSNEESGFIFKLFQNLPIKGQLISKCLFGIFNSPKR